VSNRVSTNDHVQNVSIELCKCCLCCSVKLQDSSCTQVYYECYERSFDSRVRGVLHQSNRAMKFSFRMAHGHVRELTEFGSSSKITKLANQNAETSAVKSVLGG
jgi:hypothetical protein